MEPETRRAARAPRAEAASESRKQAEEAEKQRQAEAQKHAPKKKSLAARISSVVVGSPMHRSEDYRYAWQQWLNMRMESGLVSGLTICITVWALYGDDIRLMSTSIASDSAFVDVVIFCLIYFSAELLIGCISKPHYFLSFYFWLDVCATLSLLLDVPQARGEGPPDNTTL